jgi:hypothetical protein
MFDLINNRYISLVFVLTALLVLSCSKGGEPVPNFEKTTTTPKDVTEIIEFIPVEEDDDGQNENIFFHAVNDSGSPVIGGDDGEDDDCGSNVIGGDDGEDDDCGSKVLGNDNR